MSADRFNFPRPGDDLEEVFVQLCNYMFVRDDLEEVLHGLVAEARGGEAVLHVVPVAPRAVAPGHLIW